MHDPNEKGKGNNEYKDYIDPGMPVLTVYITGYVGAELG